MKDSIFYTWIVVIFILAGILFYIGGTRPNVKNEEIKEIEYQEILQNPFSANATIKFQDMTLNADVNKSSNNALTLCILEPKTLEGMELVYDGELINLNYKGMTLGLDKNSKTLNSIFNILINSLQTATGMEIKNQDGEILLNSSSNSGDFSILLNENTKLIAKIIYPELDFICEFN